MARKFPPRKKVCPFLKDPELVEKISYKNPDFLGRFLSPFGRIVPRRITGVSAKHHRALVREIKRARMLALLPFAVREERR